MQGAVALFVPSTCLPVGTLLVIPFYKLNEALESSMSLDVFLSFWRCPKHPNTPPVDFGIPFT